MVVKWAATVCHAEGYVQVDTAGLKLTLSSIIEDHLHATLRTHVLGHCMTGVFLRVMINCKGIWVGRNCDIAVLPDNWPGIIEWID